MRVVYAKEVSVFLNDYDKSLKKAPYNCSNERRIQKVNNFRAALKKLAENVDEYSVCTKKKLGQIFDNNGKYIWGILKQTSYKDESEYQWGISLFRESKNVVRIYRVLGHDAIDETKQQLYESIMRAVSKVVKKHLNSI